jgi:hypothetical protein
MARLDLASRRQLIARHVECRRWLAPAGAAAAICLGLALQISNGVLDPVALSLVAVALVLIVGAVVTPRRAHFARLDAVIVPLIGLTGLAVQVWYLYTSLPAIYLRLDDRGLAPFHLGVALLAVLAASVVWSTPRWVTLLQIGALLAVHAALGAWIIHRSPYPLIDVFLFHKYAIAALRLASIPMPSTFRTLPRPPTGRACHGGRLQFGFPYFR